MELDEALLSGDLLQSLEAAIKPPPFAWCGYGWLGYCLEWLCDHQVSHRASAKEPKLVRSRGCRDILSSL